MDHTEIGQFSYVDGELCCDLSSLAVILTRFTHERGSTPAYVYSEQGLENNVSKAQRAFPQAELRFAVKACMNVNILALLSRMGCGFDVVSYGELERVKCAGGLGENVVFAGAAKSDFEISKAVQSRATLVVERPEELVLVSSAAKLHRTVARVMLRVRPNVDAHTHRHLTTGTETSKFGMPVEKVVCILDDWRDPMVEITGLHFHIGSLIEGPECTAKALDVVLPLVDRYGLGALDIGGGFPVCYREGGAVPTVAEFGWAVQDKLAGRDLRLYIEPGRFLVADTAVMVTNVMSQEYSLGYQPELGGDEDRHWRVVTCDAGMGDIPRMMLYDAYHPIWPLRAAPAVRVSTAVAGPYCESSDFLGRDRKDLPELQRGDLLAVMYAGAYCRSMASGYNGNLFGSEILVRTDGPVVEIGERESIEHHMALEHLVV